MRLPSISTLKSYINECEQKSGWQDKIAYQLLSSLLWSQRENCYIGYLDFENEMQDYQTFAMQSHSLNTIIFNLAAKLECIGIHTCGSICDGAGENRTHIKSFDWYASKWSFGDIVEVKFNKNKKSFHAAKIIEWNVNDLCEFKSPRDNQWHLGKIFDYNPIDSTLSVELTETAEGWK
ncbi:hypothetical protein C1646_778477, partial [Rhizophagus diaphanus]